MGTHRLIGPKPAPVRRLAVAAALLASLAPPVTAAPLDALLDLRTRPDAPTTWQVELDRDLANERLDVFGWRSRSSLAGTQIGNYAGQHLRLGLQSGRWSGDLLHWRRAISDLGRTHQLTTWQAAAQYEFGQPADPWRWGLRLSGWQDQAGQLTRRTSAPLVAQGIDAKLSELQLIRPRDSQWQLDLLGRTALPVAGLAVSGFAGAGRSLVTRSSANASARIAGCDYQIDFGAERLTASPPDGCSNAPIISVPNGLLPFDAWQETGYRASFVHLGGALRWQSDDWRLALGLELQQWRREGVDERLRQRGGTPYTSNQTLIGEVQYRVTPALSAVLRGQVMRHQFLGELPLIYNGLTASRFNQRYGLVSAGLVCDFGI